MKAWSLTTCSRLARRGGVKRISAMVYDETRAALKARLKEVNIFNYLMPWPSIC